MTTEQMKKFLEYEFWMLAWAGSVQRNITYKENASESEKTEFRKKMHDILKDKILPQYKVTLDSDKHVKNIKKIIDEANNFGSSFLEGSYKFGTAQKLLNLTLKYHWCMGWIEEPPHCPVDRIIISETHLEGKLNWTDITDLNVYEQAIEAINIKALEKNLSLAEYELQVFSRR